MKKVFMIFVLGIVFSNYCKAQTAQSVYVEIGGASVAGFNYDARFTNKQDGWGGRIGFGGVMIDGEGATFFPLGINYLAGKNGKDYFEVGGGITFVGTSASGSDMFNTTFGTINFGYRYQPKTSGIIFRANISPIIGSKTFFPFYGGISFGYKF